MSTSMTVSADEFTKMRFESPTELVHGKIVSINQPGMLHGIVCSNIGFELQKWARENSAGYVATNDTGVLTETDPDTVRGADCLFVRADRLPSESVPDGLLKVVPDLCVEVLSPSDRWPDVLTKVSEYLSVGVAEVWVVNPRNQTVQVYRPDEPPRTLEVTAELKTESVLPGFCCPVADLFAGV